MVELMRSKFPAANEVRRKPKLIRLMADYHCHPLWDMTSDQYGDIDPAVLPLSAALRLRLAEWARIYDETLNMDSPQDSGFKSEALETEFKTEGHRLAKSLRKELGPAFTVAEKIW